MVPAGGVPCTRNLLGVTSNGYGDLTILPLFVTFAAAGFRFLLGNWAFFFFFLISGNWAFSMGVSLAFTE